MDNLLNNYQNLGEINYLTTIISFILCILSALVLKHIYTLKSNSLTGKYHIGSIIPLLALTTFLVISVVKSSLALSLGLVGALSVIRFRTPIKEPEELVYLFLSISLGLGYGSGQFLLTLLCFIIIIFCIYFILNKEKKAKTNDFNLSFAWKDKSIKSTQIINDLKKDIKEIDLIKFDHEENGTYSLFLNIVITDLAQIEQIEKKFSHYPDDLSFSFYEAKILS